MNYTKLMELLSSIDVGLPQEVETECIKAYKAFSIENPEVLKETAGKTDKEIVEDLVNNFATTEFPSFIILPALVPFTETEKGFDYWESIQNKLAPLLKK